MKVSFYNLTIKKCKPQLNLAVPAPAVRSTMRHSKLFTPGIFLLSLVVLELFLLLGTQVQEVQALKKLKAKKILKKLSPLLTLLTFLKSKKKYVPIPLPVPLPM